MAVIRANIFDLLEAGSGQSFDPAALEENVFDVLDVDVGDPTEAVAPPPEDIALEPSSDASVPSEDEREHFERLRLAFRHMAPATLSEEELREAARMASVEFNRGADPARDSHINPRFLAKHYEQLAASWLAANFDPERWVRENPDLDWYLRRRPKITALAVADKEVGFLAKALGSVADWGLTAMGAIVLGVEGALAGGGEHALALQAEADAQWAEARAVREGGGPWTEEERGRWMARRISEEHERAKKRLKPIRDMGEALLAARTEPGARASKGSVMGGDLRDLAGTFTLGDDPSVWGYVLNITEVFGYMAPVIIASVVTRGRAGGRMTPAVAGGVVGGLQAASEGREEARELLDTMAETMVPDGAGGTVSLLEKESKAYRDLRETGWTHEEALEITKHRAALAAAEARFLPAALGDAVFTRVLGVGGRFFSKAGPRTRILGNVAVGAGSEALQEPTETLLGRYAIARSAGIDADFVEPWEGTAGDAGMGLIVGGASGVVGAVPEFTIETLRARWERRRAKWEESLPAGEHSAQQIDLIKRFSETRLGREAPDETARFIRQQTAVRGEEVHTLYLDPEAALRLFQEEAVTDEQLEVLLGKDAREQLEEAQATGGRIEIRIEDFVATWASNPLAEKLTPHLATGPVRMTEAQLQEERRNIEAEAQELAKRFEQEDVAPESGAEASFIQAMEAQLRATGTYTAEQARQAIAPWRAFARVMSERMGVEPDVLFEAYRVRIESARAAAEAAEAAESLPSPERAAVPAVATDAVPTATEGTEGPASLAAQAALDPDAPEASRTLTEAYLEMPLEERLSRYYRDPLTGLLNYRGLEAIDDPARPMVAHLGIEGLKWVNDTYGHDVGDQLYRTAAHALQALVPDAARVGGDFAIRARDEAHLQEILAALNEDPRLQGLTFTGAVAEDVDTARRLHEGARDEAVARGDRAPRGERPLGLPEGVEPTFDPELGPVEAELPAGLAERFADLSDQEAFEAIYTRPESGLLSRAGFEALPRKAVQVRMDVDGLADANAIFGEEGGDALLAEVGEIAAELEGDRFDAAHPSGDELWAQADDEASLAEFARRLQEEAERSEIEIQIPSTGEWVKVNGIGVTFGLGRSDAEAEAALTRSKEERAARGVRGTRQSFEQRIQPIDARSDDGRAAADREGHGRASEADADQEARARRLRRQRFAVLEGGRAQEVGPSPGVPGAETRVITPQRPQGEPARYQVIEADDLIPSHREDNFQPREDYPEGVQEREYHRQPEEQAKVATGAQALEPAFLLTDTPSALDGPPLVTSGDRALVMGGNGRAMMIKRAFRDPAKAQAYREALVAKAQSFGVDPAAFEGMRAPVLVRVLKDVPSNAPASDLVAAVRRTNEGMTQALSPQARAVAEARTLTPETVESLATLLAENPDDTLRSLMAKRPRQIVEILRRDGIITPQNQSAWLRGAELTDEAKDRLEGMFLGRVVGSGDRMAKTPKSILAKLERIAPSLMRVQGINPALDETPLVQQALDLINEAQERDLPIDVLTAQTSLIPGEGTWDPEVVRMAELIQRSRPLELAARFRAWSNLAAFDPNQVTMFAANPTAQQAREALLSDTLVMKQNQDALVLYQAQREAAPEVAVEGSVRLDDQTRTQEFKGWFGDWEAVAKSAALRGEPVANVETGIIQAREGEKASDAARRWLEENPQDGLERAGVGPVVFDARSIKDTLGHGFSGPKLNALAAVPEVIRQGVELDASQDFEGRPVLNRILAAPIVLDGKRYLAFVRLRRNEADPNAPTRFYVHEVLLEKHTRKEEASPFKTGSDPEEFRGKKSGGTGFYLSLARQAHSVNPATVSKVVDAEGRPLVVYHGTNQPLSEFSPGSRGASTRAVSAREGFFFTSDPQDAAAYADLAAKQMIPDSAAHQERTADLQRRMEEAEGRGDWDTVEGLTAELEAHELNAMRADPSGMNIVPVYLSIKNPLVVEIDGMASTGEISARIAEAKEAGHDGLILRNIEDSPGRPGERSDHYVVFAPEQIKSATGNRGTFDPSDPRIHHQAAPVGAEPRGFMERRGDDFRIVLGKKADLSTFLHETGHVFLEILGDLAEREDATQQVREDYQALLGWLGVTERSEIGTEQHEKFARGFEAYLREGKAPSDGLAAAFDAFKGWLKRIYRSIRSLNVELSDEVRGVFDRMLATDEEIARAREESGQTIEMFPTQRDARMTDEEWARYQKMRGEPFKRSERAALRRSLQEQLREKTKKWKEELAQIRKGKEEEWLRLPARRAKEMLQSGRMISEDGEILTEAAPPRLDRAAVEAAVGKRRVRRFNTTTDETAVHPDELAPMFGFASGEEMLQAVDELPTRRAWAREQAEAEMRDRHPGLLEDRERLSDEVNRLARSGGRMLNLILFERDHIRRLAGVGEGRPSAEVIERAAEMLVERRLVGRLRPGVIRHQERLAAHNAAVAYARGEYERALREKERQALNTVLYGLIQDARDEMRAARDDLRRRTRREYRAELGKASEDYLVVHDAVLAAVGIGDQEVDTVEALAALDRAVQLAADDANPFVFDVDEIRRLIVAPVRWPDLSLTNARNVRDAVVNIREVARAANEITLEGKRVQLADAIAQLKQDAEALPDFGKAPASRQQVGRARRAFDFAVGLYGQVIQPERLMESLGTIGRQVFERFKEANRDRNRLLREVIEPINAVWEKMPKSTREKRWQVIPELDKLLPLPPDANLAGPRDQMHLIMIALNMGNESNKDRLLNGMGWTEEQVMAVLNERLTAEEWAWVQSIFDIMDQKLWPEVAAKEKRRTGLAPEKIVASALETPHGTFRGGYFPAVYDPRASRGFIGEQQAEDKVSSLFGPGYTRPATQKSHTKERVKDYSNILFLDFSVLPAHLLQVVHDIAFDEFVRDSARLFLDQDVKELLQRRLGVHRSVEPREWLRFVANSWAADAAGANNLWARLMGIFKKRGVVGALGYSATVMMSDFVNPFVAMSVGRKRGGTSFTFGLPAYLAALPGVGRLAGVRQMALRKSPELRDRLTAFSNERRLVFLRNIGRKRGKLTATLEAVGNHVWFFQEQMDKMASTQIWLARYWEEKHRGTSEAEAVKLADSTVRKHLMGPERAEQSRLLRDPGAIGAIMAFQGYANVLLNIVSGLGGGAVRSIVAAQRGTGTYREAALELAMTAGRIQAVIFFGNVVGELFAGRGPDEDEEWEEWILRKQIGGYAYITPVVGVDAEAAIQSAIRGKRMPTSGRAVSMSYFYDQFANIGRLANEDLEDERRAWAAVELLLSAGGLPVVQPKRTLGYIQQLLNDEADAENVFDIMSGLLYGQRENQPANPFSAASDVVEGDF